MDDKEKAPHIPEQDIDLMEHIFCSCSIECMEYTYIFKCNTTYNSTSTRRYLYRNLHPHVHLLYYDEILHFVISILDIFHFCFLFSWTLDRLNTHTHKYTYTYTCCGYYATGLILPAILLSPTVAE